MTNRNVFHCLPFSLFAESQRLLRICIPVFNYLWILMTSDSCFLLHHYFVQCSLLITCSIFFTTSFIFLFSVRYFLIRFLYITFNSVFIMPILIFSYYLQQHLVFLIFHLFYVSSLYFVLFLISCYKNFFTISSLCLLSCGTKV